MRKLKRWKMWASYIDGADFPVVRWSRWAANHHKRAQEQPDRRVFPVEVRELKRKVVKP